MPIPKRPSEQLIRAEPDLLLYADAFEEEEEKGGFSALEEVEYLGAGNFGKVFKMSGVRKGKRRMFAGKRMSLTDPSAICEQEMLEGISHPHIIRYIHSYVKAGSSNGIRGPWEPNQDGVGCLRRSKEGGIF